MNFVSIYLTNLIWTQYEIILYINCCEYEDNLILCQYIGIIELGRETLLIGIMTVKVCETLQLLVCSFEQTYHRDRYVECKRTPLHSSQNALFLLMK
jgi:hypothetical protein